MILLHKNLVNILIVFASTLSLLGQHMEVDGSLKVTGMPVDNSADMVVVQQSDGVLGVRDVSTLNINAATYSVGDYAQGGIVFYVDPSGKHGKVLHLHSLGHIRWSNTAAEYNNGGSYNPTSGAGNTVAIVQNPNHTHSAASVCYGLAFAGYDDWYLPSTLELIALYNAKETVEQSLSNAGGNPVGTVAYWSSVESNSNPTIAYAVRMTDGTIASGDKDGFGNVRAIRSF